MKQCLLVFYEWGFLVMSQVMAKLSADALTTNLAYLKDDFEPVFSFEKWVAAVAFDSTKLNPSEQSKRPTSIVIPKEKEKEKEKVLSTQKAKASTQKAKAKTSTEKGRNLLEEAAQSGSPIDVGGMLTAWATSEIKMYFVVNEDIKMGKGKLGGQIGHATQELMERILTNEFKGKLTIGETLGTNDTYSKWKAGLSPKIVLKAPESVLIELRTKYPDITVLVRDAGKTQLKPGTLTVVAFPPLEPNEIPPELQDLHLC